MTMAQAKPTEQAAFSALISRLLQSDKTGHVWTLNKLTDAPKGTIERIDAELHQLGITHLPEDTLGGNMSIAVAIPDTNTVLRVSDDNVEPPRPYHPAILQPLIEPRNVDNFRIEITPHVMMLQTALDKGVLSKHDAREQLERIFQSLEQSNLFFWDCKMADLGVVAGNDGLPQLVIIDGGSVCPESQRHEGKIGHDTQTNNDKYMANISHLLGQLSDTAPSMPAYEKTPQHTAVLPGEQKLISSPQQEKQGFLQRIKNMFSRIFGGEKETPQFAPAASYPSVSPPRPSPQTDEFQFTFARDASVQDFLRQKGPHEPSHAQRSGGRTWAERVSAPSAASHSVQNR